MKQNFKRVFSLLMALVLVCSVLPVSHVHAEDTQQVTSIKYMFNEYVAGTQYGVDEVHKLDDVVTVTTTQCHFTDELRIYSSSAHDGYAIINSTTPIKSITLNAGNNPDTLNVYGSADNGNSWKLIGGLATAATYKDLTLDMPENTSYQMLKLDVSGSKQVRVKYMTLTFAENGNTSCEHVNTEQRPEIPATCTTPGTAEGVYCKDCETYTEGGAVIPALEHAWDEGTVTEEPGCETKGTMTYHCTRGDATKTENIDATGHNYVDGVCSECGKNEVDKYVKVGISDITSSDKVIIVSKNSSGTSYAMSNDNGTSAAPAVVSVTITDDTTPYITTKATNIKWNISKNGDNLTIYPAGTTEKWLYCTGTNNGVRVGTNENNVFTIDGNYLKHTQTSRYLGVYNGQDWRCYTGTDGNIAGQTFSFYKLVENTSTDPAPDCEHATTEERAEVPATCTEPGYTAGEYCFDCDTYISGHEKIDALGHSLDTGEVTTEATCTEDGLKTFTCTREGCNYTEKETIVATGHNYVDGICTVCSKTEPVLPFKIGDTVIFTGYVEKTDTNYELTGFADGATYGTATEYTTGTVAGTFPITVVAGNASDTYAFKNGDSYITFNGAKDVNLSTTLDAKSSWTVDLDNEGNLEIKSCSNESYYLQFNPGSPRFTTYTGGQQPIKVFVIPVKEWKLTLKDNIGANFSLNLNENDTVNFTVGTKTVTYNANQEDLQEDGTYLVTVDMAAAQMMDEITIQVEGSAVTKTYSIRQYADTILKDEKGIYSEATKQLVKEMLNYGAMAQNYFSYNVENIATKDMDLTGVCTKDIPNDAKYQTISKDDKSDFVNFYGASLVYLDRIAVRFYFDITAGSIDGITFKDGNGNPYEAVESKGHYMIEVPGINPQEYEDDIKITVTDTSGKTVTVTYTPMHYITRMYEKYKAGTVSDKPEVNTNGENLMKALYNYYLAAKDYVAVNP